MPVFELPVEKFFTGKTCNDGIMESYQDPGSIPGRSTKNNLAKTEDPYTWVRFFPYEGM